MVEDVSAPDDLGDILYKLQKSKQRILFRETLKSFRDEIYPLLCETAEERLSLCKDVTNEQLISNFESDKFHQFYDIFVKYSKHDFCLESSIKNNEFKDNVLANYFCDIDNYFHEELLLSIFNDLSGKNFKDDDNLKDSIDSLLNSYINGSYFSYEKISSILPGIIERYFVEHSDNVKGFMNYLGETNSLCKNAMKNGAFEKLLLDENKSQAIDYVLNELKKYFSANQEFIIFEDLIVQISGFFFRKIVLFESGFDDANGSLSKTCLDISNDGLYDKIRDIFGGSFKLHESFNSQRENFLDPINQKSNRECLDFVSKHLDIFQISGFDSVPFNASGKIDSFSTEIEEKYSSNKERVFDLWKRLFIARGNNSTVYNEKNVTMSIDEFKGKVNNFIASCDVGKKSWFPSKKKLDDFKKSFCDAKIKGLVDKLNGIVSANDDFLKSLGLFQLFFFSENFHTFLFNEDVDVNKDFDLYLDGELEKIFSQKDTISTPVIAESNAKKTPINDTSIVQPTNKGPEFQVVKLELPEALINELKKYFKGKLDKKSFKILLRYLKNSGKKYKPTWYDGFGVDEEFFKILQKYEFTDDSGTGKPSNNRVVAENPSDELGDCTSNTNISVDKPEILELKNIIEELSVDGLPKEKKADLYVEAFRLFYDFKNEDLFRRLVLDYIPSNGLIETGLNSVLEGISKGKPGIIVKKHGYYAIEIGTTGFRIVLQSQNGNSGRKIILDFANHGTYDDRSSYYLKQ